MCGNLVMTNWLGWRKCSILVTLKKISMCNIHLQTFKIKLLRQSWNVIYEIYMCDLGSMQILFVIGKCWNHVNFHVESVWNELGNFKWISQYNKPPAGVLKSKVSEQTSFRGQNLKVQCIFPKSRLKLNKLYSSTSVLNVT